MMNLNLQQTEQSNQGWKHFGPLTAAVVLLVAGGSLFAQQSATAKPAAQPAVARAEQEREAEPTGNQKGEGIRVHGHWVLQVKNADGTFGERREFDNSLVTTNSSVGGAPVSTAGSAMLTAILTGTITVNPPAIGFVQTSQPPLSGDPSTYCAYPNNSSTDVPGVTCYEFGATSSFWNTVTHLPGNVKTKAVQTGLTASASFTPNAAITLAGNFVVPTGLTNIYAVESLFGGCLNLAASNVPANATFSALFGNISSFGLADVSPANCMQGNSALTISENLLFAPLTETAIPGGPLATTAGQVISVTFTLSFS